MNQNLGVSFESSNMQDSHYTPREVSKLSSWVIPRNMASLSTVTNVLTYILFSDVMD